MGVPESKYKVGDIVRMVGQPFTNCRFGWNSLMGEYCGADAKIVSVRWSDIREAYVYTIDLDYGRYLWCEGCFESPIPEPDLEETDASLSVLFA